MAEFEFNDRDPQSLESYVFQALGAASMCWNPRPHTQVFDSEMALAIGNKLMLKIKELNNG